jgi:hypothetical protein
MPFADPEKRRAYLKKYWETYAKEHGEKLNKTRRDRRQSNLAKDRAKTEARNRAKGHQPRPEGHKRQTRVAVNTRRRWVIYHDRIYCNSQIGFTSQDLREMRRALDGHIEELRKEAQERRERREQRAKTRKAVPSGR